MKYVLQLFSILVPCGFMRQKQWKKFDNKKILKLGKKSFTSLIGGLLVKDLTVVGGGGFIDINLPHKG